MTRSLMTAALALGLCSACYDRDDTARARQDAGGGYGNASSRVGGTHDLDRAGQHENTTGQTGATTGADRNGTGAGLNPGTPTGTGLDVPSSQPTSSPTGPR